MNFKEGLFGFGRKTWNYVKLARIELLLLIGVVALDMLSKAIVQGLMTEGQSITLIPNFLYITYVRNEFAAFSFDFGLSKLIGVDGTRIVFLIVTILAVGVFSYVMFRFRGRNIVSRVAFALIISGAVGNFIDRLFLKYVRDFIEFRYFGLKIFGSYSFPVFNVADMALTVGVVLFLVFYIFLYKDPKKAEEDKAKAAAGAAGGPDPSGAPEENPAPAPVKPVVPILVDGFDDFDEPLSSAGPASESVGDEPKPQPENVEEPENGKEPPKKKEVSDKKKPGSKEPEDGKESDDVENSEGKKESEAAKNPDGGGANG